MEQCIDTSASAIPVEKQGVLTLALEGREVPEVLRSPDVADAFGH